MGFSLVFRSLQEVFPQVDIDFLKAVAIEHPEDADAAVECIISEILPYLTSPSESCHTPNDSQDVNHSIVGGEELGQGVVEGASTGSFSNSGFDVSEERYDTIDTTDAPYGNAKCVNEEWGEFVGYSVSNVHGGNGDDFQTSTYVLRNTSLDQPSGHLFLNTETEEFLSTEKRQNVSVADGPDCLNDASSFNIKDLNELVIRDCLITCGESRQDCTNSASSVEGEISHLKRIFIKVKIMTDGESKPFAYAYIWFTNEESAQLAAKEMDGKILNGWVVDVMVAEPESPSS